METKDFNINLSLYELAIILYHVKLGASDRNIGFEDTENSLNGITRALNRIIPIKKNYIESALWSANLLDEKNKFNHPEKIGFKEFLQPILRRNDCTFNSKYHFIDRKRYK